MGGISFCAVCCCDDVIVIGEAGGISSPAWSIISLILLSRSSIRSPISSILPRIEFPISSNFVCCDVVRMRNLLDQSTIFTRQLLFDRNIIIKRSNSPFLAKDLPRINLALWEIQGHSKEPWTGSSWKKCFLYPPWSRRVLDNSRSC